MKILHTLVRRALERPRTFYGLSFNNILHAVNGYKMRGGCRVFTLREVGDARAAIRTLERRGLIYTIKRSRYRYFPSSRAVSAYGFVEALQQKLEDFL